MSIVLIKKVLKYIFIPIFSIVILWIIYFIIFGNIHKVDNNVYRSAQLFSFNMPYYIKKHKIKSILNLRKDINKEWYSDELKISNEYNITHYNYGISDRGLLSVKKMDEILDIINKSPKPLLIHCKAGADRTSLASALYLYKIKKKKDAMKEFSLLYGHFPWLGSKTNAMDKSFKTYVNNYPQD